MSYQGNNPKAPRERQPSRTGSQQPQGVSTQQQPTQQPPQQQPTQQPPQQAATQGQQQQMPQTQTQQRSQIQQQPQTQQQPRSQAGQQVPSGTQPTTSQRQTTPTQQSQASQKPPGLSQTMGTQQRMQQQGMQQQAMAQPQQPQAAPRPRFEPTKVEDLIVTDVVTAQRDTPIRTVISSMAENNVGSVVVLDDDDETPIDVVTDRKIALALEGKPDIAEQNVEEVITGDLIAGNTEMTVFQALDTLSDAEIRRLPIVDDDGKLQGIVTLDDLLVFLGNKLSDSLDVISAQSRR